jgi:hypothetical protein
VLQRFVAGYNLFHPILHAGLCRDVGSMLKEFVPHAEGKP